MTDTFGMLNFSEDSCLLRIAAIKCVFSALLNPLNNTRSSIQPSRKIQGVFITMSSKKIVKITNQIEESNAPNEYKWHQKT